MQPSTLLLTLAATTSATILPRAGIPQFNVTNFAIGGSHGSVYTHYRFNIARSDGSDATSCSAETDTIPQTLELSNTPCQSDNYSFFFHNVTRNGGKGYSLVVDYKDEDGQTWEVCDFFPESSVRSVVDESRGGARYEVLDAETEFHLGYITDVQC